MTIVASVAELHQDAPGVALRAGVPLCVRRVRRRLRASAAHGRAPWSAVGCGYRPWWWLISDSMHVFFYQHLGYYNDNQHGEFMAVTIVVKQDSSSMVFSVGFCDLIVVKYDGYKQICMAF